MSRPKVLYLVTEPWYFANHRLDHAMALLADGVDVHVATRRGDRWDEIAGAGCELHEVDIGRGAGSLRAWLSEIRAVRRLVGKQRPDVLHAVALKPVALAVSLVAMRGRPALILSINGLGISAARPGPAMLAIRSVIRLVGRLRRVHLLFQTEADQLAVLGTTKRGVVIPGVGVDVERFVPGNRQAPPPVDVVYLGRAVVSKGLLDIAASCEHGAVPGVRLHLYLTLDPTSPGALDDNALERLRRTDGIAVHPPTRSPEHVLGTAHAAILASHAGEGVSKFVLESLACGVPVLLSAESGSGEVIDPGVTGLEFTGGDPVSIRSALEDVATWSPERWNEMAARCRTTAESQFGLSVILPMVVAVHRRAVGDSA